MKYSKIVFTIFTLFNLVLYALLFVPAALASSSNELPTLIKKLGGPSRRTILKAVKKLGDLENPKAIASLEALLTRRLRVDQKGNVYILNQSETKAYDAITGEPYKGELDNLNTPIINNRVRRAIKLTLARLRLKSKDPGVRLKAAQELANTPQRHIEQDIERAYNQEKDPQVRKYLAIALALVQIDSPNLKKRLKAIELLGKSGNPKFLPLLKQILTKDNHGKFLEPSPQIREAAFKSIKAIERHMLLISIVRNLFYGISLGSVLLLASLGLAITFGLMGVINMAHGEMLMLGAYSAYVVQNLFKQFFPAFFNWYIIAAIPIAFIVPALVGMFLERTIIRYLYGRPLETLLATWGISLILIQTVRLIFGAQNVEIANPSWLSGGIAVTDGLFLTHNRIFIILFAIFVVLLIWLLLNRTSLGLLVRAVTQRRSTAATMGIFTSKVDMWTFALGSGIAGLGGLALSQIGNVGPELGQSYIVDAFMVVVLGGVGKLAGTIVGSFGLGIINKFLEPFTGAVLGKIFVLIFIILFIQKRPQGIFAIKGRVADE